MTNEFAPHDRERIAQIHQILRDCVTRRSRGEEIPDTTVIAAHPELMPDLATELNLLHLLDNVGQWASNDAIRLPIRCPQCRDRIDLDVESSAVDVACPSCGIRFRFVPDDATNEPMSTELVGRFKLLYQLGSGAHGTVWSAQDTELGRIVAVKIPRHDDAEHSERFLREARLASQLGRRYL